MREPLMGNQTLLLPVRMPAVLQTGIDAVGGALFGRLIGNQDGK